MIKTKNIKSETGYQVLHIFPINAISLTQFQFFKHDYLSTSFNHFFKMSLFTFFSLNGKQFL